MRTTFVDAIGRKFGRLTCIRKSSVNKFGQTVMLCECQCGNVAHVVLAQLLGGYTRSCGCLHLEKISQGNPKHGMFGTPEYRSWSGMMQRCNNPNNPSFKNYGARGITVTEKWSDFRNFLSDMGKQPTGYTLERKDNEGGYFRGNCKWAPRSVQNRNKRTNRMFTINGRSLCLIDWCDRFSINYGTVRSRLDAGLPILKALKERPRK